jgi:hypothetical protein
VNALLGKFPPSWVSFSVSRKSGKSGIFFENSKEVHPEEEV